MRLEGVRRTLALSVLASSLLLSSGCGKRSGEAEGTPPVQAPPYSVANPKLQSVEGYDPEVVRGKKVYGAWCAACHGAGPGRDARGLPGTEALDALHQGRVPAILDERTDLTPEVVSYFVRNGNTSMMPFFRKTEISDEDLADLGAYLARLNSASKAPPPDAAKK